MITDIITATGRWLVWLSTVLPLSIHFMDEEYRDRESAHLSVGLSFYGVLLGLAATLFVVRQGRA